MPTVLILDDDPERHRLFRRGLVGTHTHLHEFDTAPDAIDWLRENTPDLVFLDFDLDEHGTNIKDSGTGWDVASYLRKNAARFKPTTRIVIHSLNPLAGPVMADMLRDRGFTVVAHRFIWKDDAALAAAVDGTLFQQPGNRVS